MSNEVTATDLQQLDVFAASSIAAIAKRSQPIGSLQSRLGQAFDDLKAFASGSGSEDSFRWSSDFLIRVLVVPVIPVPTVNYTPPAFFVATALGRLIAKCHARLFKADLESGRLLNQEEAARYAKTSGQQMSRWADQGRLRRVMVYSGAERSKPVARPMYFVAELDALRGEIEPATAPLEDGAVPQAAVSADRNVTTEGAKRSRSGLASNRVWSALKQLVRCHLNAFRE